MSTTTSMIYLNNNSNHCCNMGDHHQPSSTIALSQQLQRPSTILCQRRNSLPRMSSIARNNLYRKNSHHQNQGYCLSSNNHQQHSVGHSAQTSALSLQYISQYLATPDTLILPEKLLAKVAAQNNFCCSNTGINDVCHHNHHYYNLNQTSDHHKQHHGIHLDMRLSQQQHYHHHHHYHNNNDHNSNHKPDTSDSIVDAATAQLEEIIRLCRTLQKNPNLAQSSSYINNTGSVMNDLLLTPSSSTVDKYHCSSSLCNKSPKCRCSDDCIRYFQHSNQNYSHQTNDKWRSIESSTIKSNHEIDKNNESIMHSEQQHTSIILTKAGIDETGLISDNNLTVESINPQPHERQANTKKSPSLLINDLRLNHHNDNNHVYDDHNVKCQVLIDDHNIMEIQQYDDDDRQSKKHQINLENKTVEFKLNSTKSSTPPTLPPISQYSNINAPITTANIVAINNNNSESNNDVLTSNGNGIINNSNRLVVTKLVAKFEEKSSTHSASSTTLLRTSSLKQYNNDGNDHEDNYNENNTIIHNNDQLSNLNRDNNINENDKRVAIQLPLLPLDSSTSPLSTTKPKSKLKPKPPPKPVSLILLSSTLSPNTATTATILSTPASLNEDKSFGLSNSISCSDNDEKINFNKLSPKLSTVLNDNQKKDDTNINDVISFSNDYTCCDRENFDENHATQKSTSLFLIKDFESHGLRGDNQILTNDTINTTNAISSSIDNNINDYYNKDDDEINDQSTQITDSPSIVNATKPTSIVQTQHQQSSNRFSTTQITNLDQISMEDQSTESNNNKSIEKMNNNKNHNDDNDNKKCQSYCCCHCCCPNTSSSYCKDTMHNCNNKLLGIDLSKIANLIPLSSTNKRQVKNELSGKSN